MFTMNPSFRRWGTTALSLPSIALVAPSQRSGSDTEHHGDTQGLKGAVQTFIDIL